MTVEMLKVVNHNKGLTLRGRYDGKDYTFPPDEAVTLPFDAAAHIFGIGNEDKSQALNMLGLLVPGRDDLADALKKLDQVSFHEGRMTFDDETADEEVADEEQKTATRGKRSGGRPPTSQVPGGESAGAGQPASATTPA